jgi:hypothetical protein
MGQYGIMAAGLIHGRMHDVRREPDELLLFYGGAAHIMRWPTEVQG